MNKKEVYSNILLGTSIIFWGVMGLNRCAFAELTLVRIGSSSLNIAVGLLIVFRQPTKQFGSIGSVVLSLPSFIIGGVLFKMGQPFDSWSFYLKLIFLTGICAALISSFSLGKNFSIFPSVREISKKGPYQLVRHPIYSSELLLTSCCVFGNMNQISIVLLLFFVSFLLLRINQEEKLLENTSEYKKYQEMVKWKLIPGIW
jgi:protein-S-isoprenylcysteine O-methyltransferase Ste14